MFLVSFLLIIPLWALHSAGTVVFVHVHPNVPLHSRLREGILLFPTLTAQLIAKTLTRLYQRPEGNPEVLSMSKPKPGPDGPPWGSHLLYISDSKPNLSLALCGSTSPPSVLLQGNLAPCSQAVVWRQWNRHCSKGTWPHIGQDSVIQPLPTGRWQQWTRWTNCLLLWSLCSGWEKENQRK